MSINLNFNRIISLVGFVSHCRVDGYSRILISISGRGRAVKKTENGEAQSLHI